MIKKVLIAGVMTILTITILSNFASPVFDAANTTANNATLPAVERTVFSFMQWVPVVLLGAGLLVTVVGQAFGKGRRGYRRGRR